MFTVKTQSILKFFKQRARKLAKTANVQLSKALDLLAQQNGLQHWYHARQVAKKNPLDSRLVRAAFGLPDLSEAIFEPPAYDDLSDLLNDEMSGETADTNATGFGIDDMSVNDVSFDDKSRIFTVKGDITYAGDQDTDRPYSGTSFDLEAIVRLYWNGSQWELAQTDPLEVVSSVSDQDRDRE